MTLECADCYDAPWMSHYTTDGGDRADGCMWACRVSWPWNGPCVLAFFVNRIFIVLLVICTLCGAAVCIRQYVKGGCIETTRKDGKTYISLADDPNMLSARSGRNPWEWGADREPPQLVISKDSINEEAATRIQSTEEQRSVRGLQQQHLEAGAAVKVQSAYRSRAAQKELRELRRQRTSQQEGAAATKVQSAYRSKAARKEVDARRARRQDEDAAATKLQAAYRGAKTRQQLYGDMTEGELEGLDRDEAAMLGAMFMGAMLNEMANDADEESETGHYMEEQLESGAIRIGSHHGGAVEIEELETILGFVEPEDQQEAPSAEAPSNRRSEEQQEAPNAAATSSEPFAV